MKSKHLLGLLLLYFTPAFAEEHVIPYTTENEWHSPSISASGGIGAYSDNYADQFFSDPSILAQNKRAFILQFFGLGVYYSKGLSDTVSDVMEISDSSSTGGNKQMIETMNKLSKIFGRRISGGIAANFVTLKIGRISVVPYFVGTLKSAARVPSYPRISATADGYGGVGVGYSQSLSKEWDIGVTARPGYRYFAVGAVDAAKVGEDLTGASSDDSESSGSASALGEYGSGLYLPIDFAVGYQPHKQFRLNLVMHDVGGAPALSSTDTKPPVYPMKVNLGGSYLAVEKGQHKLIVATELQDVRNLFAYSGALFNRWQWAAIYKYRLGSRNDTTVGVNTGLQSGYFSGGLFLDVIIAKLEASMYAVEGGAYSGQDAEIRTALKLSTQLAF